MAKGSLFGSGTKVRLKLDWESVKGNGGSTVYATLSAVNDSQYYFAAVINQGYTLTINGSSKSGNNASLSSVMGGSVVLLRHSIWVPYTGSKSIKIEGSANMSNINNGGVIGWRTVSCTANLDNIGSRPPIPTCIAPTTSTISETTKNITVSWKISNDYSGNARYNVYMSRNNGAWQKTHNQLAHSVTSCVVGINPLQGDTYKFAVEATNDVGSSERSQSGLITVNALTPPIIQDIDVYNPYTSDSLNISLSGGSQVNGKGFRRMCALFYDDVWLWESSYSSTNPDNASISCTYPAIEYVNRIGTKAYSSDKFRITAWTENENRTRSNYVSKYFTVNLNTDGGASPTLPSPVLSGGWGAYPSTCFISGVTNLTVTSPSATLNRAPSGTALTYSISVTGVPSVEAQSATFEKLSNGSKTITVTVKDSRGLSSVSTIKCVVQSYTPPSIRNLKVERLVSPNTSGKATYTLMYSPIYANGVDGADLNGISAQSYRVSEGSGWASYVSGQKITGLNTDLSYLFELQIADKIEPRNFIYGKDVIPTVKNALSVRDWGVGIQCVPNKENALEVNGNVLAKGNLCVDGESTINGRMILNNGLWLGSTKNTNVFKAGGFWRATETHHVNDMVPNTTCFAYKLNHGSPTNGNIISFANENKNYEVQIQGGYADNTLWFRVHNNDVNVWHDWQKIAKDSQVPKATQSNGYWGLINPDWSDTSYIRTTQGGLLPYQSGGHGTIGTEGWPFNEVWSRVLRIKNNNGHRGTIDFHGGASSGSLSVVNYDGSHIDYYIKNKMTYIMAGDGVTPAFYVGNGYDGACLLGLSNRRWGQIYSTKASISVSDRNQKKDILDVSDKYLEMFKKLRPVSYKLKNKGSDRTHLGFIAQEVKETMDSVGLTDMDFGGYCCDVKQEENEKHEWHDVLDEQGNKQYIYSLRYEEFIALNTHMIQKCMKTIEYQQKEINELKKAKI